MSERAVSPRRIAACIDEHTQIGDPVVDYSDADVSQTWVDVRGKVDCLDTPLEKLGMKVKTIHPTATDDPEVTRVWFRPYPSEGDRERIEQSIHDIEAAKEQTTGYHTGLKLAAAKNRLQDILGGSDE